MELLKRPVGRPGKPEADTTPLPTLASMAPADLARIVRTREACTILGVGRTTLHRMVVTGRLPAALHISERARGWRLQTLLDAQRGGE